MILVFNAGSSSLKGKLYQIKDGSLLLIAEKSISGISETNGSGHNLATQQILNHFQKFVSEVKFIGHRVVLGGSEAKDGETATPESLKKIKENSIFAPLHNPAALAVINYCQKIMPEIKNSLFYDTVYFRDLPSVEITYPINYQIASKLKIKKNGYHGISHKYAFDISGANKYQKVVSLHLGAGCSVTAIYNSKPIATSMGLTPQGGVMMRNRCGDIDPGIILYLTEKIGFKKTKKVIEKESGLSGFISGGGEMLDALYLSGEKIESSDYHYQREANQEEASRAKLAIEIYCQKLLDFIGAYAVRMSGIDAIIFTGKIGNGSSAIRDKILSRLEMFKIQEVFCVEPDEETAIAKMLSEKIINN